ncbi:MAG TPA: response regulator transcription factor [Anaerolineaceae bacterium]|nr:response regulator transcription factor [Anaerolineaceae bacterium]
MSSIRVLLADDHNLVRAGIRSLIQELTGIEVIAEASDGREALSLIEIHRPDVVLMDIAMAGLNGLEATARVVRDFPEVRVIMLSMHANEEYVWQALRFGASGYLLKDAGTAELELAIKAVARGETYLSPPISKQVIDDYIQRVSGQPDSEKIAAAPADRLTQRQREILQLIAEGHTTQAIAQKLNISVKTVETHRMQLMERLDIHEIAGLVRYAIRIGLIRPDE